MRAIMADGNDPRLPKSDRVALSNQLTCVRSAIVQKKPQMAVPVSTAAQLHNT